MKILAAVLVLAILFFSGCEETEDAMVCTATTPCSLYSQTLTVAPDTSVYLEGDLEAGCTLLVANVDTSTTVFLNEAVYGSVDDDGVLISEYVFNIAYDNTYTLAIGSITEDEIEVDLSCP